MTFCTYLLILMLDVKKLSFEEIRNHSYKVLLLRSSATVAKYFEVRLPQLQAKHHVLRRSTVRTSRLAEELEAVLRAKAGGGDDKRVRTVVVGSSTVP